MWKRDQSVQPSGRIIRKQRFELFPEQRHLHKRRAAYKHHHLLFHQRSKHSSRRLDQPGRLTRRRWNGINSKTDEREFGNLPRQARHE